jgi:hypothetical protein
LAAAPASVGIVAVALARVVGADLSVVELAVYESSDYVQSLAVDDRGQQAVFLLPWWGVGDVMPWRLEYLVKQHIPMMCTAGRYGQRGGIPALHE